VPWNALVWVGSSILTSASLRSSAAPEERGFGAPGPAPRCFRPQNCEDTPGRWRGTRPPNRKKVHVNKILPPPWGLLGATWRLAPSHQLIGTLDPPAVTSVSAPNTRSLSFVHGGVGPGVRPVLAAFWARSPRKGLGPKGVWFESVPGGVPTDCPSKELP
jgi:hypothetical protein